MNSLNKIVKRLDQEFDIRRFGKDPGFSRFIPYVYDPINFNWKTEFEKCFTNLFNGLMIRGAKTVESVFLAVFPSNDVLEQFINEGTEGDLLFMHHPLLMECGDPRGKWGRGFVPIGEKYLQGIKAKGLSVYTCHIPMDYHKQLGTNVAIAKELKGQVIDTFLSNEYGDELILICNIEETTTEKLIKNLTEIFNIPYVDFEGKWLNDIQTVAIIAGCGDNVGWMKEAEEKGVQAYITGEIHCHIRNDYGKYKYDQIMNYVPNTSMSLIGVSHSASEFLVMKTLMKNWFETNFNVEAILLQQEKWWL